MYKEAMEKDITDVIGGQVEEAPALADFFEANFRGSEARRGSR